MVRPIIRIVMAAVMVIPVAVFTVIVTIGDLSRFPPTGQT
jgi:hypothetical protein